VRSRAEEFFVCRRAGSASAYALFITCKDVVKDAGRATLRAVRPPKIGATGGNAPAAREKCRRPCMGLGRSMRARPEVRLTIPTVHAPPIGAPEESAVMKDKSDSLEVVPGADRASLGAAKDRTAVQRSARLLHPRPRHRLIVPIDTVGLREHLRGRPPAKHRGLIEARAVENGPKSLMKRSSELCLFEANSLGNSFPVSAGCFFFPIMSRTPLHIVGRQKCPNMFL